LVICWFRGDGLHMTDWKATKLRILSFRGDELDMTTKKVNPVLGTYLFRGDKLDMIDQHTLNFESAVRGSHIKLAASPLRTAKENWIWAPVGSKVTNWT